MYEAKGREVYYVHPILGIMDRFLTVHPTKDCTSTPEEQAVVIADWLNEKSN